MWNYSEKVLDHFMNPRNAGEIERPDAEAQVGSLLCGDLLKIQLRIDNDGYVTDAKFKTFGCGAAIASASIMTELIIGKHINEVARLTKDDIVRELGGLPDEKIHCSVMGTDALRSALMEYYERSGTEPPPDMDISPIVCHCFGVTERTIRDAVSKHNATSVEEISSRTRAGTGCGSCTHRIREILEEMVPGAEGAEAELDQKEPTRELTNIERIKRIETIIDRDIRPHLKADGGDLTLVDVNGKNVLVELHGACRQCPISPVTIKQYVEQTLREKVDSSIVVKEVR